MLNSKQAVKIRTFWWVLVTNKIKVRYMSVSILQIISSLHWQEEDNVELTGIMRHKYHIIYTCTQYHR